MIYNITVNYIRAPSTENTVSTSTVYDSMTRSSGVHIDQFINLLYRFVRTLSQKSSENNKMMGDEY